MTKKTSEWLKNAVIYEVYLPGYSREGNFEALYNDLERVKELGIDIIWLMPIHPIGKEGRKGTYGSPYAIKDYRAINPLLGDEKGFKELIDKVHIMGMKIIIDVVYNHTSRDSLILEQHPEWFLKDENGNVTRKFEDWSDVYDLDYDNEDLWSYQIETLRKWADMGIDGFRCDVAPLVPIDFWIKAREVLNKDRELIWLAESVHKRFVKHIRDKGFIAHSDTELHQAFDLTYDYDGFEYLQDYFKGEAEIRDYLNYLFVQETLYPANAVKLRFLENHDVNRIAEIITDINSMKNWVVFYMLLPGATLVYPGQEINVSNSMDFFEKESIDWENGNMEFYEFFRKALSISKDIKEQCTKFCIKEIIKGVVEIRWKCKDNEYISIINLENKFGDIELDFTHNGLEMLSREEVRISKVCKINKLPIIVSANK